MAFDAFFRRVTSNANLPPIIVNFWGVANNNNTHSETCDPATEAKMSEEATDTFTCSVCFEEQLKEISVACTEFDVPDFGDADSSDDDDFTDDSDSDDEDMSGTVVSDENDASKATSKSETTEKRKPHVAHRFCADCVRGLATSACDDAPLAKGGVGLCCMERECSGVLLLSNFRRFLDTDLLARLEDRMQHETLVHAKIKNFERCIKCNSGQIMHNRPFQRRNLKFVCQECDAAHCRLCKSQWKKLHHGRTCWEFKWVMTYRYGWDKMGTPEFVDTDTAKKLTENIIRQCPKCNVSFMKSSGCNKMVCRCGETQCYACRAVAVDYNHYCNCTSNKSRKDCCNKCDLFDDVKAKERRTRDELLTTAKRRHESTNSPMKPTSSTPSSSNDHNSSTSSIRFTAPKRTNRRH
uniref:RING-type domain-containing protein n=1 Tax=Panagrellus redivivus TaxID=6233 RepID=A0A7E4VG26_PANRE